jgi:hypothetical protein
VPEQQTPDLPHRLPQSKEELIKQSRWIAIENLRRASEELNQLQYDLNNVRSLLDLPGVLDGAVAVQALALFSSLRDNLKQVNEIIGTEINTPSSGRDGGRLHDIVLRHFEETGTSQVKCEGRTVHLQSQLWASCLDLEPLKKHPDTKAFIREGVNAQTLSAYIRELPRDDEGDVQLPEGLENAIKVSETTQVQTRKG